MPIPYEEARETRKAKVRVTKNLANFMACTIKIIDCARALSIPRCSVGFEIDLIFFLLDTPFTTIILFFRLPDGRAFMRLPFAGRGPAYADASLFNSWACRGRHSCDLPPFAPALDSLVTVLVQLRKVLPEILVCVWYCFAVCN